MAVPNFRDKIHAAVAGWSFEGPAVGGFASRLYLKPAEVTSLVEALMPIVEDLIGEKNGK